MKFENEYFNTIPAPLRIVFPTEPLTESERRHPRWEKARRRSYSLEKYLETEGEVWLGTTRLGKGQVTSDHDLVRKGGGSTGGNQTPQVQITVDFGHAVIGEERELVPGDIIALDRPSDLPVCIRFIGVPEGWATGELVLIDDDLGVRIGAMERCTPKTSMDREGKNVSVPLGSFSLDIADLDSIGEGTIIPLGHAITVPFTLFSGDTGIAEGRIRAVLPRDATVRQSYPDGTYPDPARPLSAFVVTRVFGASSSSEDSELGEKELTETPPSNGDAPIHGVEPVPERSGMPRYDAVLEAAPEQMLQNLVLTGEPRIAALVLQLLGNCGTDDAARLLEELVVQGKNDTVYAFSECDSSRVETAVLQTIVEPLFNALTPGEREQAYAIEETLEERSRKGGDELFSTVLSGLSETRAKAVLAVVDQREPERARSLRESTLFFEDIAQLDDRAIQKLLREIDTSTLVYALSDVDESVRNRVVENMSKRGATIFADETRYAGQIPSVQVEEARDKILSVLQTLVTYGEIVL